MKKKFIAGFASVVLIILVVGLAEAQLIDQGNGVILDDAANQYWFQDVNNFSNQAYGDQISGIALLNDLDSGFVSSNWGDWRMANSSDIQALTLYAPLYISNHFTRMGHSVWSDAGNNYEMWEIVGRYDEGYANLPDWHLIFSNMITFENGSLYSGDGLIPNDNYTTHAGSDENIPNVGAWVVADALSVPEPASMLLVGTGLSSLLVLKRKKE